MFGRRSRTSASGPRLTPSWRRGASKVHLNAPAWLSEFARLIDETPLGAGEISSLLYAECHGCSLIITDRKGIREARRRGVDCLTTQDVMVRAINQGCITQDEGNAILAQWAGMSEFPVSISSFRNGA